MNDNSHVTYRKRPLSPHLGIYKLQISSGLSISHRISGAALFFGMLGLCWWIFALVFYPNLTISECWSSFIIKIVLIGLSLALFFHFFNGVRHLFWDAGYGYKIPVMNASGIAVMVASLIATAACWLVIFFK